MEAGKINYKSSFSISGYMAFYKNAPLQPLFDADQELVNKDNKIQKLSTETFNQEQSKVASVF